MKSSKIQHVGFTSPVIPEIRPVPVGLVKVSNSRTKSKRLTIGPDGIVNDPEDRERLMKDTAGTLVQRFWRWYRGLSDAEQTAVLLCVGMIPTSAVVAIFAAYMHSH